VREVDSGSDLTRWMTVAVVSAGTVMSVISATIVNVALPEIARALDAGSGIAWVVTSYLLAASVVLPVTGWLGDRFGHKPMYLLGLSMFTFGSLLCSMATTFPLLVAARAFQGVGGGILLPIGLVLILKVFPREQHGKAIGMWGVAAMASPAIGPLLGGVLVDSVEWNSLFLINLPLGVATISAGWWFVPQVAPGRFGRFDTVGFLTGGAGLALFVLGLSQGNRWGWDTPSTLGSIIGGAALLGLFVITEVRTPEPMLELRMFRSTTFSLAFCLSFAVIGAQYARMVFVPLQLQTVEGRSAIAVGLTLAPAAIVTSIGVSLGGRLADRIGERKPILAGVTLMVLAGFAVAVIGFDSPLWVLVAVLSIQGFGMGIHQAPATVVAMNTLPADLVGQGSTVRTLGSQVSGAVFVAGLGALLTVVTPANPTRAEALRGYEVIFYASAVGLVAALVMAVLIRPTPRVDGPPAEVDDALVEETALASME
jgi:EmrB/QacA subfamily drug resistance transporter